MNKGRLTTATLALLMFIPTAQANEQGGWVKVDANGNAIGGVIVCTPDVCGDPNSPYAKATLGTGERYIQQTKANPNTGNVIGIGANNPNTNVKINTQNVWSVENTTQITIPSVKNTEITRKTTYEFKLENTSTGSIDVKPKHEVKIVTTFELFDFNNLESWWQEWLITFMTFDWGSFYDF